MKKVKKSKRPSLPPILVPGPNEVPIVKVEAEGEASQDLARIAPQDVDKVLEVGERGLATTAEA